MTNGQLKELLTGYRQRTLSDGEVRELEGYIKSGTYDNEIREDIHNALNELSVHPLWTKEYAEEIWSRVKNETIDAPVIRPVHRIHFLKTTWFRYAAAVILIVTGVGIYLETVHTSQPGTKVVHTTPPSVPAPDVLPGSDRAVLTLSNGEKVELNNAASETINDGNLAIGNVDGELRYGADVRAAEPRDPPSAASRPLPPAGDRAVSRSTGFNTMSTPKGGQYKLTLEDGTKVWLNAASSITYPTEFTGKTREVSITGEAYFEVSKNKEKPFIVTVAGSYPPLAEVAAKRPEVDRERSERTRTLPETGGGPHQAQNANYKIEVLGTTFNINSYPNEPGKTSLLEGSIKINNIILKPNQAFTNGKITSTNTTQDIAWKNGVFDFNNLTIQQAMKQLERWYDITVVYDKPVNETFIGKVGRNLTLAQVLKTLDGLGVHFRLEGRTLHVFP